MQLRRMSVAQAAAVYGVKKFWRACRTDQRRSADYREGISLEVERLWSWRTGATRVTRLISETVPPRRLETKASFAALSWTILWGQ